MRETECFTMSGTLMHTNQPPDADSPLPSAPPDGSPFSPVSPGGPVEPAQWHEPSHLQERLFAFARWLIYLVMFGVVLFLLGAIESAFRARHHNYLLFSMISEFVFAAAVIVPGFVMARIEGHPFAAFGLPARQAFGRHFWMGAIWGFAALTLLILILRLAGAYEFGPITLTPARIFKFGVYYAVFFLLTGFGEEFLARGYSQWVLTKAMGFWPAAVLMSIGFGAIHSFNPGETPAGLVAAGLLGLFFCLTLRRTGSLWWAVGFHMSWDWGESYFYSVPDSGQMSIGHLMNSSLHGPRWISGGSVGPEGSAFVFVVIAVLFLAFSRIYREVRWGTAE